MSSVDSLKEKITSEEAYQGLQLVQPRVNQALTFAFGTDTTCNVPWWLKREQHRLALGVYDTTDVLESINTTWAGQFAVHISTEDKNMIAYTPSPEDGARDKQVRTTLGKFLRKHFTWMSDSQVARLEAAHRADLDGTLLVARTEEEVTKVYRYMKGDTGCMRHDKSQFGLPVHPSAIYASPNVGVAYLKNLDGDYTARSVVYENPADSTDKRYVRIYGDAMLKRKLERNGYKLSSLSGALLRAIRVDKDRFVMPYMDGVGGNQQNDKGMGAVLLGDFLRIIDRSEFDTVQHTHGNQCAAMVRVTSGSITLKPLPPSEFVSDLTGVTLDSSKIATAKYYVADQPGVAKRAGTQELVNYADNNPEGVMRVSGFDDDGNRLYEMLVIGTVPTFSSGQYWATHPMWDTDDFRNQCGYIKLSSKYYPDTPWAFTSDVAQIDEEKKPEIQPSNEGDDIPMSTWISHQVLRKDLYFVLDSDEDSAMRRVHTIDIPALRKQGYVSCTPFVSGGHKCYLHKDRPSARRSEGGKWFDKDQRHKFMELWSGGWIPSASTHMFNFLGLACQARSLDHAFEWLDGDGFMASLKKSVNWMRAANTASQRPAGAARDQILAAAGQFLHNTVFKQSSNLVPVFHLHEGRWTQWDAWTNRYSKAPNWATLVETLSADHPVSEEARPQFDRFRSSILRVHAALQAVYDEHTALLATEQPYMEAA